MPKKTRLMPEFAVFNDWCLENKHRPVVEGGFPDFQLSMPEHIRRIMLESLELLWNAQTDARELVKISCKIARKQGKKSPARYTLLYALCVCLFERLDLLLGSPIQNRFYHSIMHLYDWSLGFERRVEVLETCANLEDWAYPENGVEDAFIYACNSAASTLYFRSCFQSDATDVVHGLAVANVRESGLDDVDLLYNRYGADAGDVVLQSAYQRELSALADIIRAAVPWPVMAAVLKPGSNLGIVHEILKREGAFFTRDGGGNTDDLFNEEAHRASAGTG